jgi:hypothetical protein
MRTPFDIMKILASALLLIAVVAIASDTNQTTTYVAHYLEPFHGSQAYKDADSGVIFYVESDGRHVAAISPDGKVHWNRDPMADAHLERYHDPALLSYRVKTPRIVFIGKEPDQHAQRMTKEGSGKFVAIAYENSQFGDVDIKTGDFIFGGQD